MRAILAYHTDWRGTFVDYIGVHADYRKQGLAKHLINSLDAPVALCVRQFTAAEKAYIAMGFEDDATREAGIGGRCLILNRTKHPSATIGGLPWQRLSEEDRHVLVSTVQTQQKTTMCGAHNVLATADEHMRYIVCV